MIDKDKLKASLSIEQIYDLVESLGGDPQPIKGNCFISKTICHNLAHEGSYKLYYYDNGECGIFRCYTDCEGSFDVFDLVRKQKTLSSGVEWTVYNSVQFVASYFGYAESAVEEVYRLNDWKILDRYEELRALEPRRQIVELKKFDKTILNNLPKVRIPAWEAEGILPEVMQNHKIAYDPINNGIIIPHYDINNDLIGIRERTLVKEREQYGKYRPAILNGIMFNHALGFNLYNINNSKDNIKALKKAIVVESEKSTMQIASFLGNESDISVSCCGSSLTAYQMKLLLSLGVNEVVIAFDRQYKEIGDEEHKRWVKKLKSIHKSYSPYVQISFMFDTDNILGYKDSPSDRGIDVFLKLFEKRITI